MSRRSLVLAALASLVLAGCVSAPAGEAERLSAPLSTALPHLDLGDEHDHKDAASHAVAWNAEPLGWNPIAPDVTKLGRYNHVSIHGDRAYVSAYHMSADGPPGLAVFDVSGDAPVLLGTLETPGMTPIDVWPSPDGRFVFLAGHRDNDLAPPALPGEPCVGTPALTVCRPFIPAGVVMVDVQDPAAPTIVSTHRSIPSGAHTVKAHEIGGELYVFVASYGFSYLDRLASGVEILRVTETGEMEPLTRFFAKRMSGVRDGQSAFVHDMWIEEHPDGRPLMYVAYWDGGVVVADLTDPAKPAEVSDWSDFDALAYGNIHFVRPVGVIGGAECASRGADEPLGSSCRHITMAAPEFGSAEHAGEMYVIDTTDVAAPKLLARWTLPGNPVNDGGYRFSPHNFDPEPNGTRVAYAHYHGGVWVLDLAMPEEPTVEAYFFPTVPEGQPEYEAKEDAPNVWSAVWTPRGTVLASDIGTGLHHWAILSGEPGEAPYEGML